MRLFIVTALTTDTDAGLEWQLRVQAHNISKFTSQDPLKICVHVALLVLPPLRTSRTIPALQEGRGTVNGLASTIVRYVHAENEIEWEQIKRYRPIAKLVGLRAAVRIFKKSYILFVDPDVVFTYNPFIRLAPLTETGLSYASDCNAYLRSSAIPEKAALLVFGSAAGAPQTTKLGGAQYLLAPGLLSPSEVSAMMDLAAGLFTQCDETFWIAEMMVWPFSKISVHPALAFKLAHAPFSLTDYGAGKETLMVHQAGNFGKDASLFNKHIYRDGVSPFSDIPRIAAQCLVNPGFASWFYVTQLVACHQSTNFDLLPVS
jgi:hypothetical protein